MRPVDPRLLRHGRATRSYLVLAVVAGTATAALIVAQAWLLARLVGGAFGEGLDLGQLTAPVVALLVVVVLRAVVAWVTEVLAHRSAAAVKSELRLALVAHVASRGPGTGGRGTGELATLATTGIDALDGYFARYLPQLVLAVIVPVTVLVVLASQDWISAAIVAVTLPLIPVFMVLIGWATRHHTARQLRSLQRLAGHFLDVVAGLTTLKVFGRSKAQVERIREVTDDYRRTTMSTLRVAFLSSLALELLASVAVALVAVSVGLRLLYGGIGLQAALLVLVLTPEAYLPLRLVGTNFHASADGVAAADQVFAVLDEPLPTRGMRTDVPDPATHRLVVQDLTVGYPGRPEPALDGLSLVVEPGEVVAVTGPSGAGKSTLLAVLLGFVAPTAGSVTIGGVDLADLDPDAWRARVAWVPQRPHLFATTIDANLRLGRPDASGADLDAAVEAAGLRALVAGLPDGLDTPLGEGGAGLSAGERQRVALARAFVRGSPLLLLDEPTAALDGATEADVVGAIRRLARGRTVILVAHRPALLSLADQVVAFAPADADPMPTLAVPR